MRAEERLGQAHDEDHQRGMHGHLVAERMAVGKLGARS
jgi:hypothetical protein